MYATVTCLALLASLLWLRGIDEGGWQTWLAYLAVVSVAMYVHLLMVLLIPFHLVWFALAWPASRATGAAAELAVAGLTLPYLPMVWWHWMLLTSPEKLSGFNFTPLPAMLSGLALSHARGFITAVDLLWLAPVFFLLAPVFFLASLRSTGSATRGGITLPSWRRYVMLLAWLALARPLYLSVEPSPARLYGALHHLDQPAPYFSWRWGCACWSTIAGALPGRSLNIPDLCGGSVGLAGMAAEGAGHQIRSAHRHAICRQSPLARRVAHPPDSPSGMGHRYHKAISGRTHLPVATTARSQWRWTLHG